VEFGNPYLNAGVTRVPADPTWTTMHGLHGMVASQHGTYQASPGVNLFSANGTSYSDATWRRHGLGAINQN